MLNQKSETQTALIAFVAFAGLGLASGLLGLAWPSMREEFTLALDSVNVMNLLQTIAYTIAGFYIGRMMARYGSGITLLTGAILMGVCMFAFAGAPAWAILVLVATVYGLGSGILDAGLNLYMATYHNSRQMNWLHACFGVGITLGPLLMTFVLKQGWSWRVGYAVVGVVLIAIIVPIAVTWRQWRNEGFQTSESKPVQRASFAETLRSPQAWFSMLMFLAYVGVEIAIGLWAYTLLTESRGISTETAGIWVGLYWGVFTAGRIFFSLIANRFDPGQLVRVCMLVMFAGTLVFWWNPFSLASLLGLVIIGVAQAPVFPLLMTDTANRVGAEHAENGISLQMGSVGIGGAILPGLIGSLGKNYGLETMAATFALMALLVFVFHELTRLRHPESVVESKSAAQTAK